MLSFDRQRYVLDIIQVLRKRCASLCQWMDQVSDGAVQCDYTIKNFPDHGHRVLKVIKDSIQVEFNRSKIDYDLKVKQLKQERINLMQEKIRETTGKTVKIKIHGRI